MCMHMKSAYNIKLKNKNKKRTQRTQKHRRLTYEASEEDN